MIYYDGRAWTVIDDTATSGLFSADNELIRILWAPSQFADGTSILHYTADGFAREVSVRGLTDPHDIYWDGQHYVAVSSMQDAILWITVEGAVVKRFQPALGDDCWHLNSLVLHERALCATAFGRFERPREWAAYQREGTGILFRLDDGEDILTGLCCPHTPRLEGGHWIVCNSARSELCAFTAKGKLVKCAQLQDWTRGLAVTDSYILVGESVSRQLTTDQRLATVAVLDRETWAVLGRLRLPFREVYDLVLVSPELLTGLVRSSNPPLIVRCPAQFPCIKAEP